VLGLARIKLGPLLTLDISTTSDPKFVPDVGGLAANMVKSQLNCVESAVPGTAKGQSPADAVGGLTGLFGKKKKP
jgi:hypothetical protein